MALFEMCYMLASRHTKWTIGWFPSDNRIAKISGKGTWKDGSEPISSFLGPLMGVTAAAEPSTSTWECLRACPLLGRGRAAGRTDKMSLKRSSGSAVLCLCGPLTGGPLPYGAATNGLNTLTPHLSICQ